MSGTLETLACGAKFLRVPTDLRCLHFHMSRVGAWWARGKLEGCDITFFSSVLRRMYPAAALRLTIVLGLQTLLERKAPSQRVPVGRRRAGTHCTKCPHPFLLKSAPCHRVKHSSAAIGSRGHTATQSQGSSGFPCPIRRPSELSARHH